MVEAERERRNGFFCEASVAFGFRDDEHLEKFVKYATDFRNAKVIFRTAFYCIDSLGDGIDDPNLLRKVGARFSFRGRLMIPIRAPLKVDLQVTEYELFRIGIASQQVQILGVNMPIELFTGWHFTYSNNGRKKPEATLVASCDASSLLVRTLGAFIPQGLIDAEMEKIGRNIASDFRKKGRNS